MVRLLVILALLDLHCLAGGSEAASRSDNQKAFEIVTQTLPLLEQVGLQGRDPIGWGRGTVDLWILAANAQAKAGDKEDAARTLQRAVALLQRALARAAANTNNGEILKSMQGGFMTDAEMLRSLELTSEQQAEQQRAINLAAEQQAEQQEMYGGLIVLAVEQAKLGDTAGASNTFQSAIKASQPSRLPKTWLPLRGFAQAQLQIGDRAGALKTCALEVERINAEEGPVRPDVERGDIAQIEAEAGDIEGALALARSMRSRDTKEYQEQAFGMIARQQIQNGDFRGALATARLLGSKCFSYLEEISHAQARKGDIQGAMQQIEMWKDIPPDESLSPQQRQQALEFWQATMVNAIALGAAEGGDFQTALKTAARMPTNSDQLWGWLNKNTTLGQIAIEQAKAGQVKQAMQTLDAIDNKQSPAFTGSLLSVELEAGDFAEALKGTESLTNRNQQAGSFFTIAVRQAKAGKTNANEARKTLRQAAAAAEEIETGTVPAFLNPFSNKLGLLEQIARQQAAVGDHDGARQTLRRGLEFAEIKESDTRPPLNVLFDKMGALNGIGTIQAEMGDWKAAQETQQTIVKWSESEPIFRQRGSGLGVVVALARSRAKAGDAQGALDLAQKETQPEVKALMLLSIADGILSAESK